MLKKFLLLTRLPVSQDAGLLALRLLVATPLLLKHGVEKVFTFSAMATHFPDPLHIGAVPSLIIASISDAVCTVLLILGLTTRWAAVFIFVNVGVAWAAVHHFAFAGQQGGHGELIVLYLGAMVALFLMGPGKYSVDRWLDR